MTDQDPCPECGGSRCYWTEWSDAADEDPVLAQSVLYRPEPPDGTVLVRCHVCNPLPPAPPTQ